MTLRVLRQFARRLKGAVTALTANDIPSFANSPRAWWSLVREAVAGAWQRGQTAAVSDVLTHVTAWACITRIAFDVAKLRLRLMAEDDDGIWEEVDNPAYSPVLRRPNHYQNRIQFYQSWMISKLTNGNTYVLKERDARGVVVALYVLDPQRVKVLVSPDGQVYYQCDAYDVAGIDPVTVPSTEMIHDVYVAPYHPLCGVSPVIACAMAITHGQQILANATTLFQNGSQPSGVLTAPGVISDEAAKRVEQWWRDNFSGSDNVGKVAVLGDGLKFERMGLTFVEAEVIKQLEWDDARVCSAYQMPAYKVGVGPLPTYNNVEALNQQYYSDCLQTPLECIELLMDEGLTLDSRTTVQFDVEEGLLRMDSATKMKTVTEGIRGGVYTPNDGRKKFNLKPITGGDTVYLQEQDHALEALAKRDAGEDPFGKAAPKPAPSAPAPNPPSGDEGDAEKDLAALFRKALAA